MEIYLITGPGFHVGPGALLLILEEQVADRRHGLEDIRIAGGCALAKTVLLQNFIAGEVVGLAELPVGMAGMAEPVTSALPMTPAAVLMAGAERFAGMVRKEQRDAARAAKAAAREQAEDAARAADEADERRWTEEWNAVELVRRYHKGDLKGFLAAKREERARMEAQEAERAAAREAERLAEAKAHQEQAWIDEYTVSPEHRLKFPTVEDYLAERRSAV